MQTLTFSNASNAVRGLKQNVVMCAGLDNAYIRAEFLDYNRDGTVSINMDVLAAYQQEKLGEAVHNQLEGVPMLRRSVSKGVVGKAHKLFASLPAGTTRKDAIDAAVAQGIAFYTARTQYQRFQKAA